MAQNSVKQGDAEPARMKEFPSIIAAGLRITGNVVSGGIVHIEGQVDGDIQCAELTIGAAGRVNGHVTADVVRVYGDMSGTIRAKTVQIAASASVLGEMIHETLAIEAGARLNGYSRPVARVELSMGVDVRRQIGQTSLRESPVPHQPLPVLRKRLRQPATAQPPRDGPSKPVH